MKAQTPVNVRRINASERLQSQLKKGVKFCKETKQDVPLTDSNVKRIENEINLLKGKIVL